MSLPKDELRRLTVRMAGMARRFRERNPLTELQWESGCYFLPTGILGSPHMKPLVWFPSKGCVWSLKGGCTMCDFGATNQPLDEAYVLQSFERLLESIGPGIRRIHIGPGGSFFTDDEVPPVIRKAVIERLGKLPFLRAVGIETRPPFLTEERLEEVVSALPSTVSDLTLGFGLECISDLPRLVALNKGYGPEHLLRAVHVIESVNRRHPRLKIGFEVYVLLKPLCMSEQEAIGEAIRTLEWVFEHGADTGVLFLNTVKRNTIQGYLNSREDLEPLLNYQPPYLRSAIEVLRQLPDDFRRRTVVLGPQSAVPARGMPRGCTLCTWPLTGALISHNLYRDVGVLHSAAQSTCPCKTTWERELEYPKTTLRDRLEQALQVLERSLVDESAPVPLQVKEKDSVGFSVG